MPPLLACVLPRAPIEEPRELGLVLGLLLVDHPAEDVFPRERLDHLEAEVCGEGAVLVDGLPPDHPERHRDIALLLVEQDPARGGEILDPGHGVPDDREPPALLLQLVRGPRFRPASRTFSSVWTWSYPRTITFGRRSARIS